MMREFISPQEAYHKYGHMSKFADLCDWKMKDNERCVKFMTNLITFSIIRCMKIKATCIETLITFF
jgi:hypothetical protein